MSPADSLFLILDKPLLTDALFGHFSAAEIIRIGWTCWAARRSVQSYSSRAWSIHRHLRRFFRDPFAFRCLQEHTGMLISGSSALQFIDRTFYPESDLDIYVFPRDYLMIGRWILHEAGMDYAFQPSSWQDPDFEQVRFAKPDDEEVQDAMEVVHMEEEGERVTVYRTNGISDVFTFVSQMDDLMVPLKVQMIVAQVCPFDSVLSYHSTLVMNVISYRAAYCLFAWTTLEERCGVIVERKRTRHEAARAKYTARGFHIFSAEEAASAETYRSSLRFGDRWVGDHLTCTIPLNTVSVAWPAFTIRTSETKFDPVKLNSWTFEWNDRDGRPGVFCTYSSSNCPDRSTYTTCLS